MNVTDFFLHYVHHKDITVGLGDGKELKEKVIQWIQHATEEERSGFGEVMLHKQTCFWSSVGGGHNYIGDANIVFAFGGMG